MSQLTLWSYELFIGWLRVMYEIKCVFPVSLIEESSVSFINFLFSVMWMIAENVYRKDGTVCQEDIFTNISLWINCNPLCRNCSVHPLLLSNRWARWCLVDGVIYLKTTHLYAKRHLYHKLHATQTLTGTRWNLWSLCTMYFMLNNCCHC